MESCKVICRTNGLLIHGEICAFPHILGSPSSYMTLQLLPSEFPPYTVYEENLIFFISVHVQESVHY
jgi:hypothetical protein